jgi:hypothetical protein
MPFWDNLVSGADSQRAVDALGIFIVLVLVIWLGFALGLVKT